MRTLNISGELVPFQTTPFVGTSLIKTDYTSSTAILSSSIERNKTEQTLSFFNKEQFRGWEKNKFPSWKNLCVIKSLLFKEWIDLMVSVLTYATYLAKSKLGRDMEIDIRTLL